MTKIDIISGFLGAGKTTLIKKLISESFKNEKIVLIENEFGEIGIDGGFLKDAGVEITEMNSGCICCSLVGDFGEALKKVLSDFTPDRIIIEPSGVGKLSDVIKAVENVKGDAVSNGLVTVADAGKCKMYSKNFGEFYNDQIKHAKCIILSRTQEISQEKLDKSMEILREINPDAVIVTTPWDAILGEILADTIDNKHSIDTSLKELEHEHHHHEHCECHEHEHHHHEHCDCHEHEHHHHDHCDCHEHEHHHHDHCDCHEHEHHHEHCDCHEHHHGHHHADEVFASWGVETTRKFTTQEIEKCLNALGNDEDYGTVLRAKGIVEGIDGNWIHFDYVPGSSDIRTGHADITGRICVIGANLNKEKVNDLFKLQ